MVLMECKSDGLLGARLSLSNIILIVTQLKCDDWWFGRKEETGIDKYCSIYFYYDCESHSSEALIEYILLQEPFSEILDWELLEWKIASFIFEIFFWFLLSIKIFQKY